ncbi:ABC transporter permease [Ramlibacter sp.]|uniref:ABC transporter permease n=1 Tax=Ramlibacter sp. TaxID=1917967 RepID=UPI002610C00B|nr:ABC transporter permease [Ramlibacter sp.]
MSTSMQRGIAGGLLLVLAWEGMARGLHLPSYSLPAVTQILASIGAQRGPLVSAALVTLAEALAGYALGAAIGIGTAILLTMAPRLRGAILPAATAVNSVPVIAYSPLVLLWFGSGMASKIVMVALAIAFTLFLGTLSGLDRVDRRSVDLMRSFGGGRLAILWRLRLPTALPLMFAGLRVATARSVLVAVVTEMLGAYNGLGMQIYKAVVQVDFVQVWGAVFVASALSLAFFGLVSWAERKLVFWN